MQEVTAILRHAYERGKNVSRSHKCGCRHVLSLDNRSYGKIEWGEGKKKGAKKSFACMLSLSLSLSLTVIRPGNKLQVMNNTRRCPRDFQLQGSLNKSIIVVFIDKLHTEES